MENENKPLEKISNFLLDKKKENLKYNKQEIPDKLKYNSDDEESLIVKDYKESDTKNKDNYNNIPNKSKEIDDLNDDVNNKNIKENPKDNDINKNEEKEKNSYELLLLKKINNTKKDEDDKENKNIELKKEEIENKNKINEEQKEKNIDNNKEEDNKNKDENYSSKTFSRNIKINENNELNNKKNVLKLLSLIKTKMNEKEKLDKEKEITKEEMLKRAKSHEGDKAKKNSKKELNNKIIQMIYNKKRKDGNNNKSVNIKSFKSYVGKHDNQKRNSVKANIYKHHIPNKSVDLNLEKKINNEFNDIKLSQIQNGKSLEKANENKKIINNYYFSNSNYNFNNFFQNNLSPKSSNKIYKKKYLSLKGNNIDYINSYTKSNINDYSSDNNGSIYKTNIENYDSTPNYTSMNTNRNNSKNKINLKVNKKAFYNNTKLELENISFKDGKNFDQYNVRTTKSNKNRIVYNKNKSKKRNYFIMNNSKTEHMNKKRNIEVYNQKNKFIQNKKWNLFKLGDFLVIEEKILTLIEYIKYNKEIFKQCFDIMNYYFNSSLYKKFENIFDEINYINIIKLNIKFGLFSLIIMYEYSFDKNIFNQTKNELIEIIETFYNNIYLQKQQIINTIIKDNYSLDDNSWMKYLLKEINDTNSKLNFNEDNTLLIIKCINQNNENIDLQLSNLLNYFPFTENNQILKNLLFQLRTKSYDDIYTFMKKNILNIENIEGSLIASVYLRNNSVFYPINPPYIKTPLINKKYTLVLDLDETLVNFKIKAGREGYVRLRPFLFGFLEEVGQYYELIIFTSATEAYANSVIEAIEQNKKYFDFVFYRQHTIIIGNDFVKDLTRIGRPLNSTIIVDNMPQNFRFQKENGICIKPFWGQDSNDKTLYNLIPILIDIAKIGGDVRINLNKYKDDIISKITSNIN